MAEVSVQGFLEDVSRRPASATQSADAALHEFIPLDRSREAPGAGLQAPVRYQGVRSEELEQSPVSPSYALT